VPTSHEGMKGTVEDEHTMNITTIAIANLLLACALAAQAPNAPFPGSATSPKGDGKDVAPIDLHDRSQRAYWKEAGGEWKFEGMTLIGTGDSSIDFVRSFKAPFRMTFDFEMIEGNRPRIRGLGRYTLEGGDSVLALSPKAMRSGSFPYRTGRKYRVRIDVTAESFQLRVNNRLVDTRTPGLAVVPPLQFSSGDASSAGIARFSNIEISAEPVK
jgi:hypothetical protein